MPTPDVLGATTMSKVTKRAALIFAALVCFLNSTNAQTQGSRIHMVVTLPGGQTSSLIVEEGQTATIAIKDGPRFGLMARFRDADRSLVQITVSEVGDSATRELGELEVRVGGDSVEAPTSPAIRIGIQSVM